MPSPTRVRAASLVLAALATVSCGAAGPASSGAATAAAAFAILAPAQGSTVTGPDFAVAGTAPAGARVVRDISYAPDDSVDAAADGTWSMAVHLESSGSATLAFRLGDDKSTEIDLLLVVQQPSRAPATAPPPRAVATANAPATPKPAPTPPPATAEWLAAVCPVWSALGPADANADAFLAAASGGDLGTFKRLGDIVRRPGLLTTGLLRTDFNFAHNFVRDLYNTAPRTYLGVAADATDIRSGAPNDAAGIAVARDLLVEARGEYADLKARWSWACP